MAALLGVTAVLCALGLEVHGAAMGHAPRHDAPGAADPAAVGHPHTGSGAAATHDHPDPGHPEHGQSEDGAHAGCCHDVACPTSAASLPAQRADGDAAAAAGVLASAAATTLRGLRHRPPRRPPR